MVRSDTGFSRYEYNELILGEYINIKDYLSVIDQCSKIAENVYSEKRLADNKGIVGYKKLLSIISFGMMASFLVLIYLAIMKENLEYEYSAYGLLISSLVIFTSLTLYESLRNSKNSVF
jgi:hypothetical protein